MAPEPPRDGQRGARARERVEDNVTYANPPRDTRRFAQAARPRHRGRNRLRPRSHLGAPTPSGTSSGSAAAQGDQQTRTQCERSIDEHGARAIDVTSRTEERAVASPVKETDSTPSTCEGSSSTRIAVTRPSHDGRGGDDPLSTEKVSVPRPRYPAPPEGLYPSGIPAKTMERLWSQVGATGGNRSQMGSPLKRLKQADRQPVATHGNRFGAHGKEGVADLRLPSLAFAA
jgi:hypothetical protein